MGAAGVKEMVSRKAAKRQRKIKREEKMSERFNWFLLVGWLLAGFFLLALPVFLPSFPGALVTPIGISTGAMFVLSFPASVISLLISPLVELILGIDPRSIAGMYLNLNVIFLLGVVQWFVVVPRFLSGRRSMQISETSILPEYVPPPVNVEAFDSDARTPVERVFDDEK